MKNLARRLNFQKSETKDTNMISSPLPKFDTLVMFPHDVRENIVLGEIYEVIYEDIRLIVKTLWTIEMTGTPVHFCAVLNNMDEFKFARWSLLTVDRLGRPLSKLEKQYYNLFL